MPPKKISKRMESTLKKHEEHHTKKHMAKMRKLLREGKTFKQAHAISMNMVGK